MTRTNLAIRIVTAVVAITAIFIWVSPDADADINRRYAGEWAKWDDCSKIFDRDGVWDATNLPCVEHNPTSDDSVKIRLNRDGLVRVRVVSDAKADCLDEWHLWSVCRRL